MSFSTYKRTDYNNDFYRNNNERTFRSRNTSESSYGSPNQHQASKLCESWLSGKSCRFGSRCWYAHGPSELKHYDTYDYGLHDFSRNQQPTPAQKHWMMMSQQSEHSQAVAHEAILMGNRFNRDSRAAEYRNSPSVHSKQDNTKKNNGYKKTNNINNASAHKGKEFTIKPLLELLKDVEEAPLRTNSPMPFSMPSTETLNQVDYSHQIDHLATLLASLDMIKAQQTNTHEICDIYAISGFCPLGEDCCFEHKPRLL